MIDGFGREIDYLRISVTDRCNLRCLYCMPEHGISALRHADILRYEEILRIVRIMGGMGIRHLRVTGGEPMARQGCLDFVRELREVPGVESVSMTSNGILLAGRVAEAKQAGVSSLNLSLDTLAPEKYARLTRGGDVKRVLKTLSEAAGMGIPLKVNAVPIRGFNEGELVELALLAKDRPVCVRFIELMPIGCGQDFAPVPQAEAVQLLTDAFGPLPEDDCKHGCGPARYVRPKGFLGSVGFIGAVSHEFCGKCNRIRLTADGRMKLCLNHAEGADLRTPLRSGKTDEEIEALITAAIGRKPLRHAFHETIGDREIRHMNEIGG